MKLILFYFILLLGLATIGEAGIVTKNLLLTHVGTQTYGDVSIDENGLVTLLNGKTVDQAALTFWPALREKFSEISKGIKSNPPMFQIEQIGFYFSGNKGQIKMSFIQRKVSWKDYDPDPNSILFWDAVCQIYEP